MCVCLRTERLSYAITLETRWINHKYPHIETPRIALCNSSEAVFDVNLLGIRIINQRITATTELDSERSECMRVRVPSTKWIKSS